MQANANPQLFRRRAANDSHLRLPEEGQRHGLPSELEWKTRAGVCPSCGHAMFLVNGFHRCPECGYKESCCY